MEPGHRRQFVRVSIIFGIVFMLGIFFFLAGCSHLIKGMDSNTMRTAIDNCKSNNLDVILYQRPDGSVVAIRCLPKPDDVTKSVILRPKVSLPVLRMFYENVLPVSSGG